MTQRTTDGRGIEKRLYRKDATSDFAGTDAATRSETTPTSSWGLDRRTFVKAATLLGVGGGALGGLSAPVGAQTAGPWSQQAKLLASDGAYRDEFGWTVSITDNGDTAIVGAREDNSEDDESGSAYVFTRSGGTWSQQQKLTASDAAGGDQFGRAVAIADNGNTALVGARNDDTDNGSQSGSAYMFTRSGGVWSQQAKLTADDTVAGDFFGWAVSLVSDGDTAIIGAPGNDNLGNNELGSAYVFTRSGGAWSQQAKLTASDAGDNFGEFVSISNNGDTALVSAYLSDDSGTNSGSAYVFTRSDGAWSQQAKLTASDAAASDWFGFSVSLSKDGNTALVGAFQGDDGGANSGSAYVFTRSDGAWSQQAKLTADDAATGDWFGFSVSITGDGDTALIGALSNDDGGFNSGSAYVFTRSGGVWSQQQKLTASDPVASYYESPTFGHSVSIAGDGNTVFVGAPQDNIDDVLNVGSAYMFTRPGPATTPNIAVSPASHDFGEVTVGETSQQSVTIENNGDGALGVTNIALAGADAGEFAITSGGSPVSLASGETHEVVVEFAPTSEGPKEAILRIDSDDADEPQVDVALSGVGTPANEAPTAAFSYDPANPEVGEAVAFDASASDDPDGTETIESYEWDFGDGETASGQTTNHTYAAEDNYDVTLTLTDDADATDTATQAISVAVFADPLVIDGETYLPQDLDGDGEYDDIDGDGAVVNGKETSALTNIINAHRRGEVSLTPAQIDALDFNGDGKLTGADNGAYNRNRKN